MKHIFTVHSPLTFLMAYTIINDEKLPDNDVIILTSGYNPPFELDYINKSFQDVNKGFLKKIRTWNTPLAYDRYIDSLTNGKDFTVYIDLMAMYQRLLITNPKCKSFHFIEEGSATYVKSNNLDEITHSLRKIPYRYTRFKDFLNGIKFSLRGYSTRLLAIPYWPLSFGHIREMKYYCLSPDAYPGVDREKKVIIDLNRGSDIILKMAKNISLKNEYIWIEDSLVRVCGMSDALYRAAIISTIDYLKRNSSFSKVYLKLRPSQSQQASMVYNTLINENYEVEVLNNEIIIEALLANSQNCTVIGNVSSVLFYAPLLGHKSLSMFDKLNDKPKTTFDDFEVFWKNIVKI